MGAKLKSSPRKPTRSRSDRQHCHHRADARKHRLPHFSPLVSRQHAVIRCHNGWQYQLIDLGSRNGTYVNDQRVVMPVTLTDGAQIRIADN